MNVHFNIKDIIIVILIATIIIMQQCSNRLIDFNFFGTKKDKPVAGTVITKIETKWDTISIDKPIHIPKYITKTVIRYDTIFANIDTQTVLQEYYTKYLYSDTISLDSYGFITINDTLYKNSIISRQTYPKLYIPTTTITKDSLISTHEYYLGVGTHISPGEINYIGGEFLFRSKSKKVFAIGLGINQQLNPVVGGRLYWNIK